VSTIGPERAGLLAELEPELRDVLMAAAAIVAHRLSPATEPATLLESVDGVKHLLRLLNESPGLRAAVAQATTDPEQPASELCSPDSEVASKAVNAALRQVESLSRKARSLASRARRSAKAQHRPAAQERAIERAEDRLDSTRQARDVARHQALVANAQVGQLRLDLAALTDDAATTQAQLDANEIRIHGLTQQLASVPMLATNLADLLGSLTVEPTQGTDPWGYWTSAAAEAGLPLDTQSTISHWLPRLLRAFVSPRQAPVTADDRGPTVHVLGGGTEIGGSAVLVTAGRARILIDAGTRPGGTDAASIAPPLIDLALSDGIDAIVITHAHNDHAGWVPAVVAAQPGVPVFATDATAALLGTMWFDSAKVLAHRARNERLTEDADREDVPPPPYGRAEVLHALGRLTTLRWGQRRTIRGVDIELFPAGHIVGAAGVLITAGDKRVVISGDVSRAGQKSVGGIAIPDAARGADLLLLESTYGATSRPMPRELAVSQFVRDISSVVEGGGRVLVPAFALGRAQEVALLLAEHLPDVSVLIDGLARDVSAVYEQHNGPDGTTLRIFGGQVRAVQPGGTRAAINQLRTGVVIATSGMLSAGPAVSWARELLPDPRAGLMVVGYQDEESPGARLLALAETGGGLFDLPRADGGFEKVPVAAKIARYGLGAHATADELVTISAEVDATTIMLVHGERRAQEILAGRLRLRRQDTLLATQPHVV
jgi:Cft2 family RNA processing exonuclease